MPKKFQDVLMGTNKMSFYDEKGDTQGLSALHEQAMKEDRELYTYLLYLDTDLYLPKSLIVEKLLSNSLHKLNGFSEKEIRIENYLISKNIKTMNVTHALKTLLQVTNSANNARTTRIVLEYLFQLEQLDRVLIKFKSKVTTLLKRVLGSGTCYNAAKGDLKSKSFKRIKKYTPQTKWSDKSILEMMKFLFLEGDLEFSNEHLSTYKTIQTKFQRGAIETADDLRELLKIIPEKVDIPIEVMEGFLSKNTDLRHVLYESKKVNISNKQQVQMENKIQEIEQSTGVKIQRQEIDYSKLTPFDILRANYNEEASTGFISNVNHLGASTLEEVSGEELKALIAINNHIDEVAKELRDSPIVENSSILIDLSGSMAGSSETKNHPLLKTLEIAGALVATRKVEEVMYAGGITGSNGILFPSGDSDMASKILELVEKGHRNILIISDGFNNRYDVSKTVDAIKEVVEDEIYITHINPTFSGRRKEVQEIANNIATIGVNSAKDLVQMEKFFLLQMNKELFKMVVLAEILKEMEEI